MPLSDPAIFFCTGGGEAIDTAAKIVRRYWAITGEPERTVIVSRSHAYHGTNAYGTSLSGIPAVRDGYRNARRWRRRGRLRRSRRPGRTLDELGGTAAAFVGEPLIGAGGAIPPPDGYWPAVERICRERGVLLIADEVISGFGRLGRWFGCERYGFTPDLMTCAKGISSGYVPLGAVVVSDRVRAPFWDVDAAPFLHGSTYAGHPGACVAGLANIDILEREGLVERAAALEPVLSGLLEPLLDLPAVAAVRCTGLAAAVELDGDLLAAHPTAGPASRSRGATPRRDQPAAARLRAPDLAAARRHRGRARADRRRDRRRRDRDVLAASLSPGP